MSEKTNHLASTQNSIKLTENVGGGPGWGNATHVVRHDRNYDAGSITGVGLTDAKGNKVVVGTFMGTRQSEKIIVMIP
jgi:hypothetical protein